MNRQRSPGVYETWGDAVRGCAQILVIWLATIVAGVALVRWLT